MSTGLLMNLAAIENSDHMTSLHASKYDFDGWYRATITELVKVVRQQHAEIRMLRPSPTSTHTPDTSPEPPEKGGKS